MSLEGRQLFSPALFCLLQPLAQARYWTWPQLVDTDAGIEFRVRLLDDARQPQHAQMTAHRWSRQP
jgi:hypothetical protein